MADWHQNYNATSAPLVVGGMVISGIAGGEQGMRGFVAAFDQATGKEAWRFWTVPNPGEPGSETWQGKDIEHPGVADLVHRNIRCRNWTRCIGPPGIRRRIITGTPREGDNLYSCSMLALDAKTGKLKWYYQFTPHDVWDWDATETPVLVDAEWEGQPRKLLLHANRNGFFYVLDRTNGKFLLAKPFVQNLTWAKEIGADGRPMLNPCERADGGHHGVPVAGWGDELVFDIVQSGDWFVLCADARKVQHLYEVGRWSGRRARVIWADGARSARVRSRRRFCARSISRRGRSPGSCRRRDRRIPGEGRWPRRPAWCFSAKRAAR